MHSQGCPGWLHHEAPRKQPAVDGSRAQSQPCPSPAWPAELCASCSGPACTGHCPAVHAPASHSKLHLAWSRGIAAPTVQQHNQSYTELERPQITQSLRGSNHTEHTLSILLFALLHILGAHHGIKYSRTCSTGRRELDVRSRITTDRFPDNSSKYYRSTYLALLV